MRKTPQSKINSKITSWGNSYGLRLPKDLVNALGIDDEMPVEIIQTSKNSFEVKETKPQKVVTLKDLVEEIDENNLYSEYNWGKPEGKEVW